MVLQLFVESPITVPAFLGSTGLCLSLITGQAFAETCTISPSNTTVSTGDTVAFSASTDLKGQKTYDWTFAQGTPPSSTSDAPSITYNTPGIGLLVSLNMTGKRNTTANCTTTVTVEDGGVVNDPPVLAPIGDKTVTEGDSLSFQVSASDPDGPAPLTLTASPLPSGATFTDNGNGSGDFSWPNATPAGSYDVTFTASDAFNPPGIDSETITITVDGGGVVNDPPVLDPIGDKSVSEGGSLSFPVSASDADGPTPLTLTASPLPSGATFTDNGNGSGDFSWPNATPAGSYDVTFTASDAFNPPGTDSETITITVNAVGAAVSINSTSQSCGSADVSVNGIVCNDTPVPEQPFIGNNAGHAIVAINDLGMHCGDLDTRISSILPPFQVLLAQVIQKGSQPQILSPNQADVFYSAASNPDDPILNKDPATRVPWPDC